MGIEGVDLYGGTKHSTVTALGQIMTPEQIQRSQTRHASAAFKRYMLPDINEATLARQAVAKVQDQSAKVPLTNLAHSQKAKWLILLDKMVEAAGVEPASENDPSRLLHTYPEV